MHDWLYLALAGHPIWLPFKVSDTRFAERRDMDRMTETAID